jgi:phosphate transport system substrate-binding protein
MKRRLLMWTCLALFLAGFMAGCGSTESEGDKDLFNLGVLHISCDESFKPVIDQQVQVYNGRYPHANIIVHYKPEAECLKDFLVDSIRMVIATRGPSEKERDAITDSLKTEVEQLVIAHDLIAVIVHPSQKDTMFSMQEIRDLLTGKLKKDLIPVFDGRSATSTVRFMLDSVLRGEPLGKNVVAAKSSVEVIEYVSRTANAVGFVGYGWIGNADDTAQLSYRKKIRTARIESTDSAGAYIHPSQFQIYTRSYPMVRDLVYTLKERHTGLAHGFAHYLTTMPGQLAFRRAYIMPVVFPNYLRDAELKDTINK